MNLKDILDEKEKKEVISAEPEMDIREALATIVKNKIGALLVKDKEEKLVGIITERDILWHLLKDCEKMMQKKVSDIMTKDVIVGIPEDNVETAEKLMTVNRFRHLPVMDGNEVAGIISIGDLVKCQLGNMKVENRYLTDYITGKYPV
jgi:CBS domain-containing protein